MSRGRLTTVKPRLQAAPSRKVQPLPTTREHRLTGRKLQDRRMKVWTRNPHCAHCGKLCDFPGGFELDHVVPLYLGGADDESNCQVLCVAWKTVNGQRVKLGCHAEKTARDMHG